MNCATFAAPASPRTGLHTHVHALVEVRFGPVGLAQIRIRTTDPVVVQADLAGRVAGIEKGAHLAMYYADRAIVVVNPEVSSVRDPDRILGLLASKTSRAEAGNGGVKEHLLLTRYSPKRVAAGEMMSIDDVREILGLGVVGVIPESQDVLSPRTRARR